MFCKYCGANLEGQPKFCHKCGQPVHESSSSLSITQHNTRLPFWVTLACFVVLVASIVAFVLLNGKERTESFTTDQDETSLLSVEPTEITVSPATTELATLPDPTPINLNEVVADTLLPTASPSSNQTVISFSCTDALGCLSYAKDEPIKIAYMLVVSGPNKDLGEASLGGIQLALDKRGQTVLQHPIELIGQDSGCNAEGGQIGAQTIIEIPKVVGVIGTNCSGAAVPASHIISNAGLVIISPSNTSPSLTDPNGGWKPGYFRTSHNDIFQGRVAAEFVYSELDVRTAATIHDGDPYTESLQRTFAETFEDLGGVITYQGAIPSTETDFYPILKSIGETKPDALYFPVFFPMGSVIVKQSSEIPGLENTILISSDALLSKSFIEATGAGTKGMFLSGPLLSIPEYDRLNTEYLSKFGSLPTATFPAHAYAYDATNILLNAIETVAIIDTNGTLHIGHQDLREAIAATTNFYGTSGIKTCNQYGDCDTGDSMVIFKITEAEIAGNWPPPIVWQQ